MIVSIPYDKAPLKKYEHSPHLAQIRQRELLDSLSKRGVELVGHDDGVVVLSLRNLALANGSLERGRLALMDVLKELSADAVTIQPQDIEYLNGKDVYSHAIGRGLESGIQGLTDLLHGIPCDEDARGENDGVPLFDRLDQAAVFVSNDRIPAHADERYLREQATIDLVLNGVMDTTRVGDRYADWMDAPPEETPPALPRDFQTTPQPYRSIFDRDNF